MQYKANELFVVRVSKVVEVIDKKKLNVKMRPKGKFYVAKLMKVGKNCCVYKLILKDKLVLDKSNMVNSVGEYYINYREALNLATRQYKKEYYTLEEIKDAEMQINKEREEFIK